MLSVVDKSRELNSNPLCQWPESKVLVLCLITWNVEKYRLSKSDQSLASMVLLGNTICITVFLFHTVPNSNPVKSSLSCCTFISRALLQHKEKNRKASCWHTGCRSIPITSHKDFMCFSFEMHIILWRLFFWKKDPLWPKIWNLLEMGK